MVLTKSEISENLFEKLKLTKRDSKACVEFFFEEVRKSLEKGENVKLSGFGREKVVISKRRVVTFKAGQKLKNRIENCFIKK
ncbi:Integration host factor subunit alpha, partial [Aphis craccivora]